MKYLIALIILIILITLYVLAYLFNSKVDKPSNCKELTCEGCKLNCNKRGEINE